jgi:hypothetical protein
VGVVWSSQQTPWPYSRFYRLEPLLFLPSSSSIVLTMLSGPRSRHATSRQKLFKQYMKHYIPRPINSIHLGTGKSCPGCGKVCYYVGFEVLTTLVMNVAIFWDIVLCSPYVNCGGTYHLYHQGWKKAKQETSMQHMARQPADFRPWRWRQYVPSKRQFRYGLHVAISQKTATFKSVTVPLQDKQEIWLYWLLFVLI